MNAGSDDWNCAYTFNDNLILNNNKTNPLGLKIKTAIVGFGSAFSISGVTYDKSKTQVENIAQNVEGRMAPKPPSSPTGRKATFLSAIY